MANHTRRLTPSKGANGPSDDFSVLSPLWHCGAGTDHHPLALGTGRHLGTASGQCLICSCYFVCVCVTQFGWVDPSALSPQVRLHQTASCYFQSPASANILSLSTHFLPGHAGSTKKAFCGHQRPTAVGAKSPGLCPA